MGLVAGAVLAWGAWSGGVASAADGPAPRGEAARAATAAYSATTGVGVHNAYEKAKYPYFADALDSGAAMLELNVWTNAFGSGWRVSHSNPLGNDNNCENARSAAELRTNPATRAWPDACGTSAAGTTPTRATGPSSSRWS